jgi:hypothetical protein
VGGAKAFAVAGARYFVDALRAMRCRLFFACCLAMRAIKAKGIGFAKGNLKLPLGPA